MISLLEREIGDEVPPTKKRGKIHDYLGMIIDYSQGGGAKPVANPNVHCQLGPSNTVECGYEGIHHMVAKMLFVSKWSGLDIAFLTMWAKNPDEDDYQKLLHVVKYTRGITSIIQTMSVKSNSIQWWIDASFAFQSNIGSHKGKITTLAYKAVYSQQPDLKKISIRQNINAESSAEADLVGLNNILGQNMCAQLFC